MLGGVFFWGGGLPSKEQPSFQFSSMLSSREDGSLWLDLQRSEYVRKPLEFSGGTSPGEGETIRLRSTGVDRNLAPTGLGLHAWNLDGHKAAEQQAGRDGEGCGEHWEGGWGVGARSFHLTGCFINVIKHGQALRLCIIPDLHSRGMDGREKKKKGRLTSQGREREE